MPYLNESEMLRKIKLRRFLREFAGGNQKKFADLCRCGPGKRCQYLYHFQSAGSRPIVHHRKIPEIL